MNELWFCAILLTYVFALPEMCSSQKIWPSTIGPVQTVSETYEVPCPRTSPMLTAIPKHDYCTNNKQYFGGTTSVVYMELCIPDSDYPNVPEGSSDKWTSTCTWYCSSCPAGTSFYYQGITDDEYRVSGPKCQACNDNEWSAENSKVCTLCPPDTGTPKGKPGTSVDDCKPLGGCCSKVSGTCEDTVASDCTPGKKWTEGQLCGSKDCPNCKQLSTSGTCYFYQRCLEESYNCGDAGYPIGYGQKYCIIFSYLLNDPTTSPKFKSWLESTLVCLQTSLVGFVDANGPTCDNIKQIAFDSHPACYAQKENSVCDLTTDEQLLTFGAVDFADLLSLGSAKQAVVTLYKCGVTNGKPVDTLLDVVSAAATLLDPRTRSFITYRYGVKPFEILLKTVADVAHSDKVVMSKLSKVIVDKKKSLSCPQCTLPMGGYNLCVRKPNCTINKPTKKPTKKPTRKLTKKATNKQTKKSYIRSKI